MVRNALSTLIEQAGEISGMDESAYAEFCRLWHAANDAVKDAVFAGPNGGPKWLTRHELEHLWGAQSTVFMADILPFMHAKLIAHYRRPQVLQVLDVGAGSGFGSRFLAGLHMDHKVYARLEVEALDVTPTRKRWIEAMAPNVGLRVADLFTLPSKAWDLVVCSHVVEHIDEPRPFIEKLQDVCRGFAFVYSPYNENPRIRPHKSTITKADYAGLPCELHLIKSMGWHPNKPDDLCLLAVIDCRPQQRRIPAAPVRVDDPEGRRTLPEPGQDATPPSPDLSENPDSGVS